MPIRQADTFRADVGTIPPSDERKCGDTFIRGGQIFNRIGGEQSQTLSNEMGLGKIIGGRLFELQKNAPSRP